MEVIAVGAVATPGRPELMAEAMATPVEAAQELAAMMLATTRRRPGARPTKRRLRTEALTLRWLT